MDKIEQIINKLEFDEIFESEVCLSRLISNVNSKEMAQNYIDSYYVDLNAGRNPKLYHILLIGNKEAGVAVFARAISNSFGSLMFHTISGNWLSDGVVNLHSFLGEGSEFSSYYIDGDRLNSTAQSQLYKVLSEKKIFSFDVMSKNWQKIDFNRLVILSVEKKEMLAGALLKQFPIKLYLNRLSPLEINLALNQRVNLMGLKISSLGLLHQISECSLNIGQAIEILSTAYRISRIKSPDSPVVTEKEVNQALRWLDNNKLG